MTTRADTPSGLTDRQAAAFLEATEVWERWNEARERAGDGVEKGAGEDVDAERDAEERPTCVPPARSPATRWVSGRLPGAWSLRDPPPPGAGGRSDDVGGDVVEKWPGGWRVNGLPASVVAVGGATCGVLIKRGTLAGKRCHLPAGQGTPHVGAGQCVVHGGAKRHGRTVGAWLMAHAFGAELDITPWEGLLRAVRVAAGKSAYCEWVISQAKSDLELEGRVFRTGEGDEAILVHPDTGEPLGVGEFRDLSFWVKQSELWHDRMAKTSKMAVDAGVAAWQVERAEGDANAIARVLNAVLEGLGDQLDEVLIGKMRKIMRNELMAMDVEQNRGQLVSAGDADGAVVDSTYREE